MSLRPCQYLLFSTFLMPCALAYTIFPSFPRRLSEAFPGLSKSVVPLASPCPHSCPGIDHCSVSFAGLERRLVFDYFLIHLFVFSTWHKSMFKMFSRRCGKQGWKKQDPTPAQSAMTSLPHVCLHPLKVFIDREMWRRIIHVGELNREDSGGIFFGFFAHLWGGIHLLLRFPEFWRKRDVRKCGDWPLGR